MWKGIDMGGVGEFRSTPGRERYFAAYDLAMAECPLPDEVHDVVTAHGSTRVYRFGGGGAPVVLLPGMLGTAACYAELIPALGSVYAVDTLGEAGRSVQTAPFVDVADRARCLDAVFERLGLTGVHLVGGSTGGWHAVNQAVHAPGRLASISLLDPTTVTSGFAPAVLGYGVLGGLVNRDWVWRRFLRWSAGADVMDRADVRLVLAGIREYRVWVPFQVRPAAEQVSALPVPVLAVFAARSAVHDGVAAARLLADLVPGADVEVLPEAGHFVYLRAPDRDRIAARVRGFVGRA